MKQPLSICMMAPWPSVHTDFWLKAARDLGHDVHYLHLGAFESDAIPSGVAVHSIEPRRPMGLRYTGQVSIGWQVYRFLRRIKPDVLHIHTMFAYRRWHDIPWLWPLYSYHPLVVMAWGGDLLVSPKTSKSTRRIIQWALRSADMIMAQSEAVLDSAANLGAQRDKLFEIQYGIDTDAFSPAQDTNTLREQLRLGTGPIVYSPRAFKPTYNLLAIVEAIPIVLSEVSNCRFMFRKRADFHDDEYEASVCKRISELGVEHAVRILPPAPQEELPPYYAVSDAIVSLPSHDSLSRSVLESMACGAFPIVSDLPALREWIVDGENGLIVESVAPPQIANSIVRALSDHSLTQKARRTNREIVEQHFSQRYWGQRLDDLYHEAVASRKAK